MIRSYFKIKILAIRDEFVTQGHKGLTSSKTLKEIDYVESFTLKFFQTYCQHIIYCYSYSLNTPEFFFRRFSGHSHRVLGKNPMRTKSQRTKSQRTKSHQEKITCRKISQEDKIP